MVTAAGKKKPRTGPGLRSGTDHNGQGEGKHSGNRLQWGRTGGALLGGFSRNRVEAALAAGIFHRREEPIAAVKAHLKGVGVEIR